MSWLSYSDDEVSKFHPVFHAVADDALVGLGLSGSYEWQHHPASAGVGVVPDFVLCERLSGRWIVVIEIKRRPDTVNSERTQIQAKGYAEANVTWFRHKHPHYFAVTNLEFTYLFALRGGLPPRECRVEGMSFASGSFLTTPKPAHRAVFQNDIETLMTFSISELNPSFQVVWPSIVKTMFSYASQVPYLPLFDETRNVGSAIVRDYFSIDRKSEAKNELLLRCLVADYLAGILNKYNHPKGKTLNRIGHTLSSAANSIFSLNSIDFVGVFGTNISNIFIQLQKHTPQKNSIESYLSALYAANVAALAACRGDSLTLADILIEESAPALLREGHGRAATDPELASLLVGMAITSAEDRVLDPGFGEGNLLSAAYDRLIEFGSSHAKVLNRLSGIEADAFAARVAALRISLKEPRLADSNDPCHLVVGDMFANSKMIANVDVIVMNPPFKRYEDQDEFPVPFGLREHCRKEIEGISPTVDSDRGQTNLYVLYVEFVIKAARPGATLAFVLDNKWFHNSVLKDLRKLILDHCAVLAVVTYPHSRYFEGLMIATSMLILKKGAVPPDHSVYFVRVEEPGLISGSSAAAAIRGGTAPAGWTSRKVYQSQLTSDSWKKHFSEALVNEFRSALPVLPSLFQTSRRGSLAKEGGGIAVFEFPQKRTNYGPVRLFKPNGTRFQTTEGVPLTPQQNASIRHLAAVIPDSFLGYAINKADTVKQYELALADVTNDKTIETPIQRAPKLRARYRTAKRVRWTVELDKAVEEIKNDPKARKYAEAIHKIVGLDENVLPRDQLWNALREPYAGELVVPRKQRVGHRVHVNQFAFVPHGRQIRVSSNFLSYGGCHAVDQARGLDQQEATRLVSAWLLSSFGHLQFELESNNREGARCSEQHHVDKIRVLDPRSISKQGRTMILQAYQNLPYPIRTDLRPELQPELVALDTLFAGELIKLYPTIAADKLLNEVWGRLYEMHEARNH